MTVFLVRHAKAGARGGSAGPDEERELSDPGRRQAAGLVELLAAERVDRVLSSWYPRCVQTVEPLAHARGLPVEVDDGLAEGADPQALLARAAGLDHCVLCSHGDVVGGVVYGLGRSGVRLEGGQRWEKASTWALEVAGGRVSAARYLPPPAG